MSGERKTALLIETGKIVPEQGIIAQGQVGLPGCVPIVDGQGHRTVLQVWGLGRQVELPHAGIETAARGAGGAEGVIHQLQQQEGQRHLRLAPDGLAQRQGTMRGELHDQPLRQRLQRAVILFVRQTGTERLATRGDDGSGRRDTGVNGGVKSGHRAAQNQASGGAPSAMARALVT